MESDQLFALIGIILLLIAYIIYQKTKPDPYLDLMKKADAEMKKEDAIKLKAQKSINRVYETDIPTINLCFASQSGNAARFANILAGEAEENNVRPRIIDLIDYDLVDYNDSFCVFLIATTGEGDPTDNSKDFLNWLQEQKGEALKGLKFTCFGLGNSSYEHYNVMGKKMNKLFLDLGGVPFFEYGEGDDAYSLDDNFNDWKKDLWDALKKVLNKNNVITEKIEIKKTEIMYIESQEPEVDLSNVIDEEDMFEFQTKHFIHAKVVTLVDIYELRQNNVDGSTVHLILNLENSGISYETGHNLGIYPENDEKLVNEIAEYLGLNLEKVITMEVRGEREIKLPFPDPISIRKILTYFCDFQGQLRTKIMKDLSKITSSEESKNRLSYLASKEGKKEFETMLKSQKTLFDILKEHQIKPTLKQFIELTTRIAPRLYTISSSNLRNSKEVHITCSLSISKLEGNREKYGVTSRYFNNLLEEFKEKKSVGKKIRIDIRESGFKMPERKDVPIIMVGPGAGIAPFRGFCQENQTLIERNMESYKFLSLYFGCRHENGDYLFKDELKFYKEKGVLQDLYCAFSRDSDKKVYVQDLLRNDKDKIYDAIEKDGYIFLCGNTGMGKDVLAVLEEILIEKKGISKEAAHDLVQTMESRKHFVKELWG